ncbi:MAG: gamma-glutamyltransferase family protein, partial [Gemmatimonadaceae bacterium]|nr:gamma-glutamyltransferase family protein [Gemmatimonadaceae bacterium]
MYRVAAACTLALPCVLSAQGAAPLPVPGRSIVTTTLGIVAASQPLAAQAGVQVLSAGGNAIDAAIAANATIGLMEPTGNGVGGDLFAIIYEAKSGQLHGINASGWAASGLSAALLRGKGMTAMPQRGVYSVTVPGAVAGWHAMRERFGRLPFSTILAPAIYYAEQGFPLTEVIAGGWRRSQTFLASHPNSAETYLPNGKAPAAGELFRNPALAGSLRRIAERGRDGFYTGPTAQAIVELLRENGGTMTLADLADFQPEWIAPIKTTYRGWTVYELPPNGQGIAALMMLDLMEQFPLRDWGFHSLDAMHVMIEAKKLAYADMLRYVGDPRFGRIPVTQLLDKSQAAVRAKQIDMTRATCAVTPREFTNISETRGSDTIYLTVIDAEGNIVSLIQSNYSGFGSGLVPRGQGF